MKPTFVLILAAVCGWAAVTPEQAIQDLRQRALEITVDPSSGYQPEKGGIWPRMTAAQKEYNDAMAAGGTQIPQEERGWLTKCGAVLQSAIDEMERGYRIDRTPNGKGTKTVQDLYAKGRNDYAQCQIGDIFVSNSLPPGAVASGDPDAPDAGATGFLGSFPGTKESCSFCYTYLWESGNWKVNPLPTSTPGDVGHGLPNPGDAVIVYQQLNGTKLCSALHFAVYKGNNVYYQRNGVSSIEVVNGSFFTANYSHSILRYVNPETGQ